MKLIKTDKTEGKEIAVGDIVKVNAEGRYSDVPVGALGVVSMYDSIDKDLKVYSYNDYDYFTSEQLEVVMYKDGSLPESVEPTQPTFDIQITSIELANVVEALGSASGEIGFIEYGQLCEILQGAK